MSNAQHEPDRRATRIRGRVHVLVLATALFLALLVAPAGASADVFDSPTGSFSSPTISSDKADYAPGETVILTGDNWLPGEHVHITVNDSVGQTWLRESDMNADESGSIRDEFQLPDSFIAEYAVTAVGDASGTAQTTFTDGNLKVASANDRDFGFTATPYSTTNCTGTASGATTTDLADANGTNAAAGGNTESVLITANLNANSPNQAAVFSNWTTPGSPVAQFATGYSATDRAVCVVGFQSGSRDLVGNYVGDATPPQVNSINRLDANPTNTAGTVRWTVTFSESVTGVDTGDFALVSTGLGGAPAITGVTGSAATYTVTASTGTGSGTLKLNLNDNDTIVDATANKLSGTGTGTAGSGGVGNGSFEGQTYTIDRSAPTIAATAVTLPDNSAYTADTWTNKSVRVTFTCTDTGGSGKATDTASGNTDVTAETTASGTTVNSSGTCTDNAGNAAAGASFGPIKIDKTAPSITDQGPTSSPNGAGWYNADVTNRFKASDSLSGLDSACLSAYPASGADRVQSKMTSGEGLAVKVSSDSCTDAAGNIAAAIDSASFKIDQTAPSITDQGATSSPNGSGWYNADVTNKFRASDSLSGPNAACVTAFPDAVTGGREQSKTTTGEGAAVKVSSSGCTDVAGNTAVATESAAFKIDQTAPSITDLGPTSSPNANGWYNADVTNGFKASDSLSGPNTACETAFPDVVTGGRKQSKTTTGEGLAVKVSSDPCTDAAGNTAAAIDSASFKIDQTAPSITDLGPTSSANGNGWYSADVTNEFKASDSLSGLDSDCLTAYPNVGGDRIQSKTTTGEGTAIKVSSDTCSDVAGNSAAALDSDSFKIDQSDPTSHANSPAATNQSPFTVDYTASDQTTLSGLEKVELYVRTPEAGTGYVLAATDNTPSGSGESFTYTPTAGEGTYRFYTVAYDVAGNFETSPVSYDTVTDVETGTPDTTTIFDQTAPVTTDDADPNWHNSAVTVTLTPTDEAGGSGVDKTFYKVDGAASFTVGTSVIIGAPADHSNDGVHTIYYYSTDKAGNEELANEATVKIDTEAPAVQYTSASPAVNANGWWNVDVTATFTATDGRSGFAGPSSTKTGTSTTSGEGAAVTVGSPAFTDLAGNTAVAGAALSDPFKIDKTNPALAPVVTPNPITLGGTATVASNASDNPGSGIDTQSCGSLNTSTVGTKTVTCTATDRAGNTNSKTVNYSVEYGWNGFLQPINDTAHQTGLTQSRFKLGSTVPAKFVLRNAAGQIVQQSTNPTFSRTNRLRACDSNTTSEPTSTDLAPDGGASYSWDGSQYHYNWSTKPIKEVGVYRIYANLADGTQRWVDICLW